MKKRIASLFLAVLMTLTAVSTTAAAAVVDEGIMTLVNACPECLNGTISTYLAAEVPGVIRSRTLTTCSCGNGRYNCYKITRVYEQTYKTACDNCGFTEKTEPRTVVKTQWEHFGCKGSGCGH